MSIHLKKQKFERIDNSTAYSFRLEILDTKQPNRYLASFEIFYYMNNQIEIYI